MVLRTGAALASLAVALEDAGAEAAGGSAEAADLAMAILLF
jgi:hypothetical protein